MLHARIMETIVDSGPNEHVLITTWSGCQRTGAEENVMRMHVTRVEDQTGPVQQAAVVIPTQDQHGRLVLNILVDEELCVVRGIGCKLTEIGV